MICRRCREIFPPEGRQIYQNENGRIVRRLVWGWHCDRYQTQFVTKPDFEAAPDQAPLERALRALRI